MNKRRRKKAQTKFARGGRLTETEKRYLSSLYGFNVVLTMPAFMTAIDGAAQAFRDALEELGRVMQEGCARLAKQEEETDE
jgi:hypothetical protein